MKRTGMASVLAAAIFLTACSGESPVSTVTAKPGSEAHAAAASAPGARTGQAGNSAGSAAGAGASAGASAGEGPTLTRKVVKSRTTPAYSFQAANSSAKARFDDAAKPVRSLYDSVRVYSALSGGAAKADVAVFTFPAARAKDARFQGQIVSQLVGQASGSTRLSYQNLNGHTAAVVRARSAAVGWFSGRTAVIVLARTASDARTGVSVAGDVAYAYSK